MSTPPRSIPSKTANLDSLVDLVQVAATLLRDALAVDLARPNCRYDVRAAAEVLARVDPLVPSLARLLRPENPPTPPSIGQSPPIVVPTAWSVAQADAVYDFLQDITTAVWEAYDKELVAQYLADQATPTPHLPDSDNDDIPF